jgi:hypothetical protein
MDIHKAKPVHGLKELAKEVGIIVIGVLIALGAEQSVDVLHWKKKVHEASEAMRLELRDDDGPQAFTRVALASCFDQQLNGIQGAIESGRDRSEIATLVGAYRPPNRSWDSEAWQAAIASDVGSHVPADQMVNWSKPYRTMPALQVVNAQEHSDQVSLEPLRIDRGRLSGAEAEAMLAAVRRLRDDNFEMRRRSLTLLFGLDRFGMVPDQQHRLLGGLRDRYGACVVTPSVTDVDPADQLDGMRHDQRAVKP